MRDGMYRAVCSFQGAFSPLALDLGSSSMRGVAFSRRDQILPILVAILHRHFCDTGRFHGIAVVPWVCNVSPLPLADDLTFVTSENRITWECKNGGQLWSESAVAGYGNSPSFPSVICGPGWNTLFAAFIISLLADIGFQVRKTVFPRKIGLLTSPVLHSCRDRSCTLSSSTGASRAGYKGLSIVSFVSLADPLSRNFVHFIISQQTSTPPP